MLDVVDALSAHYHEHLDAILAWSWRLFCARWARMLDAEAQRATRDRARQDAREEAEQRDEQRELLRQIKQRGGGVVDGW